MITVYNPNATADSLQSVELERPERAGQYWQGIQHGDLVTKLKAEIVNKDFAIEKELYSLNKDQTELVGAYQLKHPTIDIGDDQSLSLGFSTSNAMKKRLQVFVGSSVTVCTNGMVTGEIVLERKHTINFDLMVELDSALVNYMYRAQEIPLITQNLKTYELTQRQSDLLLMEAGRKGYLPWSRIGQVEKEYRVPKHPEFKEKTSWSLLNAFTEVVKQSPAHRQMAEINQFRGMLPVAN